MDNKICSKCGNSCDSNLMNCPVCGESLVRDNVINPFQELELEKIQNENNIENNTNNNVESNNEDDNDSIIFTPGEHHINNKIDIINKRNISLKKKKKKKENNYFLSYLLLLEGMTLLFIILLSALNKFELISFIHYTGTVLLLIISFNLTYRDKDTGYYLAIVASVSMLCMLYEVDYISFAIGIFIFVSSFVYLAKKS